MTCDGVEKLCANLGNFMLSALLDHGYDLFALPPGHSRAALHCQAAAAGYEQRRNEVYNWDGMKRGTSPFLVIQHTLLGEGRLDYAGTQHHLTAGRTMLVTMPQAHRYWLERGGHWEYFWFLLTGREALRLAREVLEAEGPVLTLPIVSVERLAAACLKLIASPRLSLGEASTLGYSALMALHDGVFAERAAAVPPMPAAIRRVFVYVEGNLGSALPVDRLAELAGMSRAHFVRRFTTAVGVSPSNFVQDRRMDRIERLLLATEMTVADIAAATGFADGNYLAKAFRRERGLAPLAFRATRAEAT